jgi:hypothetical protein
MRSRVACVPIVTSTLIVAFATIGASPSMAQTRVTSLEELRRELAAGDVITLVPAAGPPVAGRLRRVGTDAIDVRLDKRTSQGRGPRDVTMPLTDILSLERPRDPSRNGAILGAGIGAGIGGGLFLYALAIDRNDLDEWAGFYAGAASVFSGVGALIGWAVDAAHSKPHIRFDASPGGRTKVHLHPASSRGRGIALVVSISR